MESMILDIQKGKFNNRYKISIVSPWYNEILLAPLFFNHYHYADEIHILLDTDSNDGTREFLSSRNNVIIHNVNYSENSDKGFDAKYIKYMMNKIVSEIKVGWIYAVDSDEFIFPEHFEDVQTFLERQNTEVINCLFYHVYRHETDRDIDYDSLDVISQRIHGNENGNKYSDWYIKPSVFRADANVTLGVGNHRCGEHHIYSKERYIGAHWKFADREIAIRRRLANRDRMSRRNKAHNYGHHDWLVTVEEIDNMLMEASKFPLISLLTKRETQFNLEE